MDMKLLGGIIIFFVFLTCIKLGCLILGVSLSDDLSFLTIFIGVFISISYYIINYLEQ